MPTQSKIEKPQKYIRNEKTNNMEQKWISVDEKLPETIKENDYWSENVLAWCNGRLHVMAYYQMFNN